MSSSLLASLSLGRAIGWGCSSSPGPRGRAPPSPRWSGFEGRGSDPRGPGVVGSVILGRLCLVRRLSCRFTTLGCDSRPPRGRKLALTSAWHLSLRMRPLGTTMRQASLGRGRPRSGVGEVVLGSNRTHHQPHPQTRRASRRWSAPPTPQRPPGRPRRRSPPRRPGGSA